MAATQNDAVNDFFRLMSRYHEDGTVFHSRTQRGRYYVASAESSSCVLRRITKRTEDVLTAGTVEKALNEVIESPDGLLVTHWLGSRNQILRSGLLQHPMVALSVDGKAAVLLNDENTTESLLADYLRQMRVDKQAGINHAFKPAMVLSVLEGIDAGEIDSSRIAFDDVLPRYLSRMEQLGQTTTAEEAAKAFGQLSEEPFWLISYRQPSEHVQEYPSLTLDTLHERVRWASLRYPFQQILNDQACRRRIIETLKEHWWPGHTPMPTLRLNEALLAEAVEKTIRPWLITEGKLQDVRSEGYHHQQVLPAAGPRLTREAISEDPIAAVRDAIKASQNLLSQYEHVRPVQFLETCDQTTLRDRLLDLLYGGDELEDRVRTFLDWGKYRKADDGTDIGFNATIVSYLLAATNPGMYAFCKPTVYQAAAKALLGDAGEVSDPIARVEHTRLFYAEVLRLFRERFALPFEDLMHVHIAFFVMNWGPGDYPDWENLMAGTGDYHRPTSEAPYLNTVLYGPPGTGKTYETIRLAVEICDGSVSDDRQQVAGRYRNLQEDGRIEFVTFHQSYGYEDFVEGIRPLMIEDGDDSEQAQVREMGYECRDGVFKRICALAGGKASKPKGSVDLDLENTPVWKMSLGNTRDPEQADIYDDCIENGVLALGYGKGLDFAGCDTRSEVLEKLRSFDPDIDHNDYNITSVDSFKNKMNVGDLVVVSKGNHKFRAIGRVTGDYQFNTEPSYHQTRAVEWLLVAEESIPREKIVNKIFSQATIYRLQHRRLKVDGFEDLLSVVDEESVDRHVLIIDEINRGNIAKILGELITLIEPDKRVGETNELRAVLPYSGEAFGVPPNLYIIGTMNTADRSIAFLDTALRRRFRFRELMPNADVVRAHVGENGDVDGIDVAAILEVINRRVELLYDREHQIGHSYFLGVSSLAELRDAFVHTIIPLLQEYFYGDWNRVCAVLGCPFDSETGKPATKNRAPMIKTELLQAAIVGGSNDDDVPDRIRCSINPTLLVAKAAELGVFFDGVVGELETTEADAQA